MLHDAVLVGCTASLHLDLGEDLAFWLLLAFQISHSSIQQGLVVKGMIGSAKAGLCCGGRLWPGIRGCNLGVHDKIAADMCWV